MSVGRWAICLPAQLGRMFVARATTLCRLQRSRMFVVCWAFVSLPQRGSMFVGRATTLCRLQRSRMFVVCWAFVFLPQRGQYVCRESHHTLPAPAEPNVCSMLGICLPAPAG